MWACGWMGASQDAKTINESTRGSNGRRIDGRREICAHQAHGDQRHLRRAKDGTDVRNQEVDLRRHRERRTALHRHELGNVPAHGADVAIIGEDVRQAEQEEDAGVEEQHVVDGGRHQRC